MEMLLAMDMMTLALVLLLVAITLRFTRRVLLMIGRSIESRRQAQLVEAFDWTRERRRRPVRRSRIEKIFFG